MEQHLRIMKDNNETISDNLKNISSALIGNEFTAGIGIVHRTKENEERINKLEDKIELLLDNMKLVKWFGSGIGAMLIAIIINILQKQFEK